MISLVEISGCTASAPKELKEKADYVACHCNKGAVADFLGYLTEKIKKNQE
jgi:hydroxymethylpyrimidine pyrophosphatase-like HAD family hydrolase